MDRYWDWKWERFCIHHFVFQMPQHAGWAMLKSGVWHLVWIAHVKDVELRTWTISRDLPRCALSGHWNQKWSHDLTQGSLEWNTDMPSDVSITPRGNLITTKMDILKRWNDGSTFNPSYYCCAPWKEVIAQLLASLPLIWETKMEFQNPGFRLAQTHLEWWAGEWKQLSLTLAVSFTLSNK